MVKVKKNRKKSPSFVAPVIRRPWGIVIDSVRRCHGDQVHAVSHVIRPLVPHTLRHGHRRHLCRILNFKRQPGVSEICILISFINASSACTESHLESASRAQYTPPTPTRRNCRVSSRRRCVHEFATSWRQFCRVVGVNTPVGSRHPVYNFLCWQPDKWRYNDVIV